MVEGSELTLADGQRRFKSLVQDFVDLNFKVIWVAAVCTDLKTLTSKRMCVCVRLCRTYIHFTFVFENLIKRKII